MWYGHMLWWDPPLFFFKKRSVCLNMHVYIYVSTARILVQSLQAPDASPLLARYPQAFERPRIRLLQAT